MCSSPLGLDHRAGSGRLGLSHVLLDSDRTPSKKAIGEAQEFISNLISALNRLRGKLVTLGKLTEEHARPTEYTTRALFSCYAILFTIVYGHTRPSKHDL
jgi:hypothetical protein